MAGRIKWIDRKFTFNFPADFYPEIMERLRGTPPRIENLIRGIPESALQLRENDPWSIKEHIGHLSIIETLFTGRLDDYEAARDELRPADMENTSTKEASYNERTLSSILEDLWKVRSATVTRLEGYPAEFFSRTALHPRLQVPMRAVDCLYFFAEHDDYHLARITDLKRRLGK